MICGQCSTPLDEEARFCSRCGAPVLAQADDAAATLLMPARSPTPALGVPMAERRQPPALGAPRLRRPTPRLDQGSVNAAAAKRSSLPLLAVVLVLLCAAGVAAVIVFGGGEASDGYACEAGRQVSCPCPGGGDGAQVCADDGQAYGACECGSPSVGDPAQVTRAQNLARLAQQSTSGHVAPPSAPVAGVATGGWTDRDIVPCPANIGAVAAKLVPADRDERGERVESVRCTAGLFPAPGWVVDFRRWLSYHRLVINAESRSVVARTTDGISGSGDFEVAKLATRDFDADGDSEVLVDGTYSKSGYSTRRLSVLDVRGGALVEVFSAILGDDNSGAAMDDSEMYSYEAEYTITKESDGKLAITIKGSPVQGRAPWGDSSGYIEGTARFRWEGDRMVRE